MTSRARFGDFVRAVTSYLDPPPTYEVAVRSASPVSPADELAVAIDKAVLAMKRYELDAKAVLATAPDHVRRVSVPWELAEFSAREALAEIGQPPLRHLDLTTSSLPSAERVNAATTAMVTGRDLLQTHAGTRDLPGEHSEWLSALSAKPVARALLLQLSEWAQQLAPFAGETATAGLRGSPGVRRYLLGAHHGLRKLRWAVEAAHSAQPVREIDLKLLHAVPLNVYAPRSQPAPHASVVALCRGIVLTGERVRRATRIAAAEAGWSPEMTIDSFRRTANSGAIVAHNCQLLLGQLAGDSGTAEIGIPRATFYRWRQLRKGPRSIKLPNGDVRIRRSDLDRWLASLEDNDR